METQLGCELKAACIMGRSCEFTAVIAFLFVNILHHLFAAHPVHSEGRERLPCSTFLVKSRP